MNQRKGSLFSTKVEENVFLLDIFIGALCIYPEIQILRDTHINLHRLQMNGTLQRPLDICHTGQYIMLYTLCCLPLFLH